MGFKKVSILGFLLYAGLFIIFITVFGKHLIQNISSLLTPTATAYLIQNRWDLVLLYILIFSVFAIFLFYKPIRRDWRSSSLYIAFIIALFAEMFGFPLTVYFLSSVTPTTAPITSIAAAPSVALTFEFFGTQYNLLQTDVIAGIISIVGVLFIFLGWRRIYVAYKSKAIRKPVTDGLYSLVRHPQYTGILLIATAWLFAWPTLPTLILWPVLLVVYYRLARREEREMLKKFGIKYTQYAKRTPMFLPFLYT